MIKATIIILLALSQSAWADCDTQFSDLVGKWAFTSIIYRGQQQPKPNPNLNLYYQFNDTHSSRMWWDRNNEDGFCERIGLFDYDSCQLKDQITWINPKNAMECGKDPDMQKGQTSISNAYIKDDMLHLEIGLGDEPLVYIWERLKQ